MSIDFQTGKSGPMSFIDAVRTLRSERGLSYESARDEAIAFWAKKGWELPRAFSAYSKEEKYQ